MAKYYRMPYKLINKIKGFDAKMLIGKKFVTNAHIHNFIYALVFRSRIFSVRLKQIGCHRHHFSHLVVPDTLRLRRPESKMLYVYFLNFPTSSISRLFGVSSSFRRRPSNKKLKTNIIAYKVLQHISYLALYQESRVS